MTAIKYKKIKEKRFKVKDKVSGYEKALILKTFQLPNGMTENFFIDKGKDSVQIFAVTKDQQVVCVRQFRAGEEEVQIELPGGSLEPGEDPLKAASRELLEETSFSAGKLISLGKVPYSPYNTGNKHMFMATECEKTSNDLDLDPNEFLEVILVPIENFRTLMASGQVRGYDTAYIGLDRQKRLAF